MLALSIRILLDFELFLLQAGAGSCEIGGLLLDCSWQQGGKFAEVVKIPVAVVIVSAAVVNFSPAVVIISAAVVRTFAGVVGTPNAVTRMSRVVVRISEAAGEPRKRPSECDRRPAPLLVHKKNVYIYKERASELF